MVAPLSQLRNSISKLRKLAPGSGRRTSTQPGSIDRVQQGVIEGWVKDPSSPTPLVIDILLDGQPIATGLTADIYRQDVEEAGHGDGRFGFSCRLPGRPPGEGSKVEVRLSSNQKPLLDTVITKPGEGPGNGAGTTGSTFAARIAKAGRKLAGAENALEGKLEAVSGELIRGWAVDPRNKARLFDIDILLDDLFLMQIRNDVDRPDLKQIGKSAGRGGFRLEPFLNVLEPGEHVIAAILPDGSRLTGSFQATPDKARVSLSSGVHQIDPSEVAVIVPIYNAADDLDICLQRLAAHTPAAMEILLVDDASTDPRIADLLSRAAMAPNIRVLHNDSNLGFTRTVNRGLDEIGTKHAILLNSDARVTPGWARGLLRAASSRPRVATVTAMSDRAGAFSAPDIGNENALPAGVDEVTYSRAFRSRSLALYPVVPTGNGFCMFVNRDCVDEIGAFDDKAFPRGYGEENDFCLRAGRVGWTHLVDDRTYVFHDRSKSFGETKAGLMAAGQAVVNARYTEYAKAIRTFSTGPKIALARLRARQALLDCNDPKAGLPAILYVLATQIGGTPQTNMDLMREISDEMAPWLLHCDSRKMTLSRLDGEKLVTVRTHTLSEPVDALTHRSGEYDAVMRDWLATVDPEIVHIRHLAWHGLSLPALARAHSSRVIFSFHDFYTLCPTVKLLDENDIFCGGTCTATDGQCRAELWPTDDLPPIKDAWVHVWRERFADVLKDCDAYVTTSRSARKRIGEQLGLDMDRFFVIPHGRSFATMRPQRHQPRRGEPVRILLPGNISAAKGRDIVTALLDHDQDGHLEFHVLGAISDPDELKSYDKLFLHGTYQREEFESRVAEIDPHLGAVFSIWDETYCHTLTELWSAGLPAITFDFPTVAGRVRESGAGWVVPHDDIAALYDRILSLSFDRDEQMRADQAVIDWQMGKGVGRTTQLMAAGYREVYRHAAGGRDRRPVIAVLTSPAVEPARTFPTPCDRLEDRTVNSLDRPCVFVPAHPESLLANIRDGNVDVVILQATCISTSLLPALLDALASAGVPHILDLDDAERIPVLEPLIRSAALVTVPSDRLRALLADLSPNVAVLPDRLSERMWRGQLPVRKADSQIRALVWHAGHRQGFDLVAPALAAVARAEPAFRVSVIGSSANKLPDWADAVPVPPDLRCDADVAAWMKNLSADVDFALIPPFDGAAHQCAADRNVLAANALGLAVLAADRTNAGKLPHVRLVAATAEDWQAQLLQMIADIRAGKIDRGDIRADTLAEFGLQSTLPALDEMLVALAGDTTIPRVTRQS